MESKVRKLCITQGFTLGVKGLRTPTGAGRLTSWTCAVEELKLGITGLQIQLVIRAGIVHSVRYGTIIFIITSIHNDLLLLDH